MAEISTSGADRDRSVSARKIPRPTSRPDSEPEDAHPTGPRADNQLQRPAPPAPADGERQATSKQMHGCRVGRSGRSSGDCPREPDPGAGGDGASRSRRSGCWSPRSGSASAAVAWATGTGRRSQAPEVLIENVPMRQENSRQRLTLRGGATFLAAARWIKTPPPHAFLCDEDGVSRRKARNARPRRRRPVPSAGRDDEPSPSPVVCPAGSVAPLRITCLRTSLLLLPQRGRGSKKKMI